MAATRENEPLKAVSVCHSRLYRSMSQRLKATTLDSLDDNALYCIFTFLVPFADLTAVAGVCRTLRNAVLSSTIWAEKAVDICMVQGCFGCGRIWRSKAAGLLVCRSAKMLFTRLHLNALDLSNCISSIVSRNSVRNLYFRLESDFQTHPFTYNPALSSSTIESLTIYRWPTFRVNNASSTAAFFRQVGHSLTSLKCMESAPELIFEQLQLYAPRLSSLVLQGDQVAVASLNSFHSDYLQDLTLHLTSFKLNQPLQLSSLTRLELFGTTSETAVEVQQLIQAIPGSVRELALQVRHSLVNETLIEIGHNLHNLHHLIISLVDSLDAFEGDDANNRVEVSHQGIRALCTGCPRLQRLEITQGDLPWSIAAFNELLNFTSLQRVRIFCSDEIISALPHFLRRAETLQEITLFDNTSQYDSDDFQEWAILEGVIEQLSEQFPAMILRLEDQHGWENNML